MIKNYLYISFTTYIYVRLKVLIWTEDGLMYGSNLSKTSGDALFEIYDNVDVAKPLIIDCRGIDGITDHSWDLFFKKIEISKRQVIFIKYNPIEEKINYSSREFCPNSKVEKDSESFIIYYDRKLIEYATGMSNEIKNKLKKDIEGYLLDSFVKNERNEMKLLSSTPFKANGEYNASMIIAEPQKFIWTSMVFADFIEDTIKEKKIGSSLLPLKFLSVSLRSSPIAAAVALLLNKQIMTIEHLGPMRKYFYPPSSPQNEHYEYIYIGDYSFAGTEIRITKMHTSLTGSKLEHAFVLGSLFDKDRFEDFHLHSFSDLRSINPTAEYNLF